MDRLEMARKLFENPKLKAKNNWGLIVKNKKMQEDGEVWLNVIDDDTDKELELSICVKETWEIIEPKLKEFCWGEVYYLWNTEGLDVKNVKSCATGLSYARAFSQITLAEFKGKWTIEGHYEDGESGSNE